MTNSTKFILIPLPNKIYSQYNFKKYSDPEPLIKYLNHLFGFQKWRITPANDKDYYKDY